MREDKKMPMVSPFRALLRDLRAKVKQAVMADGVKVQSGVASNHEETREATETLKRWLSDVRSR